MYTEEYLHGLPRVELRRLVMKHDPQKRGPKDISQVKSADLINYLLALPSPKPGFPRPMPAEERLEVVSAIIDKYVHPIMKAKGRDYTQYLQDAPDDAGRMGAMISANANFQGVADLLSARQGIDKYVTWAVYFVKHIQAILSWVCTRQVKSEPIEGRMADAINYVFILWSMLVEDAIVEDPRAKEV